MLLSLLPLDAKLAERLKVQLALKLKFLNFDRSIKIESMKIERIIMSNEKQTSQGSSGSNEGSDGPLKEEKSVLILSDQQPKPIGETAVNLPIHVGTYIYFNDPRWWGNPPKYVDVAPTVRIVSISSAMTDVPRFEDDARRIRIASNGTCISVCFLPAQSTPALHFENVHPRRGRSTRRLEESSHPNSTWTLHRIRANQLTELALSSCKAAIYYEPEFADCAWSLVHWHENRLDAAYVLLLKKDAIRER